MLYLIITHRLMNNTAAHHYSSSCLTRRGKRQLEQSLEKGIGTFNAVPLCQGTYQDFKMETNHRHDHREIHTITQSIPQAIVIKILNMRNSKNVYQQQQQRMK